MRKTVNYLESCLCLPPVDGETVIKMASSAKCNLRDIGVFLFFCTLMMPPQSILSAITTMKFTRQQPIFLDKIMKMTRREALEKSYYK